MAEAHSCDNLLNMLTSDNGYADNEAELLEYSTHICEPEIRMNADIGRWTLLDEAPLGHDVAAMAASGRLHNPQHPRQVGRKSTARLAPHSGPTSKRAKTKA